MCKTVIFLRNGPSDSEDYADNFVSPKQISSFSESPMLDLSESIVVVKDFPYSIFSEVIEKMYLQDQKSQ